MDHGHTEQGSVPAQTWEHSIYYSPPLSPSTSACSHSQWVSSWPWVSCVMGPIHPGLASSGFCVTIPEETYKRIVVGWVTVPMTASGPGATYFIIIIALLYQLVVHSPHPWVALLWSWVIFMKHLSSSDHALIRPCLLYLPICNLEWALRVTTGGLSECQTYDSQFSACTSSFSWWSQSITSAYNRFSLVQLSVGMRRPYYQRASYSFTFARIITVLLGGSSNFKNQDI